MGLPGFYSGDPATSDKDAARFHAGDIEEPYLRGDAEYRAALAATIFTDDDGVETIRPKLAAALICDSLASQYAVQADETTQGVDSRSLTKALSQKSRAFAARARELRAQGAVSSGGIWGLRLLRV